MTAWLLPYNPLYSSFFFFSFFFFSFFFGHDAGTLDATISSSLNSIDEKMQVDKKGKGFHVRNVSDAKRLERREKMLGNMRKMKDLRK